MAGRLLPAVARRAAAGAAAVLVGCFAGAVVVLTAAPASAHVVPSTTVQLAVHEADVTADFVLPTADLVTAMASEGLTTAIPTDGSQPSADAVSQVETYLEDHTVVTSDGAGDGQWSIDVAEVVATQTEQYGTGAFPAVTATATWTPPAGASPRAFTLTYDAILHQVVTADVFVVLASDDADPGAPVRNLGEITLDTRSGTFSPLVVDLDATSAVAGVVGQVTGADATDVVGFTGMVRTGISHIAEGTDHQLFLLTLLLPAPLLVVGATAAASVPAAAGAHRDRRRWDGVVPAGTAVRRITATTLAFTLGHSITLALGALGLPVPQQPVEAAIAVSILVAAAHAIRPVFPGREPLVGGLFGLVHGLAFSETLRALDLSGAQLVTSLLGFNVGIELMQLAVVVLVLPPLVVQARTRAYPGLRTTAAVLTGVAAVGWLLDRVGLTTPLGAAADSLGAASPYVVGALWVWAAVVVAVRRGRLTRGWIEDEADPVRSGSSI